jgi:putative sterol carrier protein
VAIRQYNELQLHPGRYRYLIGIDPGFYTTGIGVIDTKYRGLDAKLWAGDLDDALGFLSAYDRNETLFVLEYNVTTHGPKGVSNAIAGRIGSNVAAAKYTAYLLEKYGYVYLKVYAGQRDRMDGKAKGKRRASGKSMIALQLARKPTKLSDADFFKFTKIPGNFPEHAKDAYTLVHDETRASIVTKIKEQLNREQKQAAEKLVKRRRKKANQWKTK